MEPNMHITNIWMKNPHKEFEPKYTDPKKTQNRILAKDVSMSMNSRLTMRNNNILVMSNPAYFRRLVAANMRQQNSNWVVLDDGGAIWNDTHQDMIAAGYQLHVIDCQAPTKYNLFTNGTTLKAKDWEEISSFFLQFDDPFFSLPYKELYVAAMLKTLQGDASTWNVQTVYDILHQMKERPTATTEMLSKTYDNVKHLEFMSKPRFRENTCEMVRNAITPFENGEDAFTWKELKEGKHVVYIVYHSEEELPVAQAILTQGMLTISDLADEMDGVPTPCTIATTHVSPMWSRYLALAGRRNLSAIIGVSNWSTSQQQCRNMIEHIADNCDTVIFHRCDDIDVCAHLSQFLGIESRPKGLFRKAASNQHLIVPDDAQQLPSNRTIIKVRGCHPIMASSL